MPVESPDPRRPALVATASATDLRRPTLDIRPNLHLNRQQVQQMESNKVSSQGNVCPRGNVKRAREQQNGALEDHAYKDKSTVQHKQYLNE